MNLLNLYRKWRHNSKLQLYRRQRARITDEHLRNLNGGLIYLLESWKDDITFEQYHQRQAELIPYREPYPRVDDLVTALREAYAAIYGRKEAAVKDLEVRPNREYTMDYFLSDAMNFTVSPRDAFVDIYSAVMAIDVLLIELEDVPADRMRHQYYLLRYSTILGNAMTVLDKLVELSDLVKEQ